MTPAVGDLISRTVPTIHEARAMARDRFRVRLQNGEKVGGCACGDDAEPIRGPSSRVIGARFIDSGRVYYFDPQEWEIENGDWVVVETDRGREAARVVIAPKDIATNMLTGGLKPVLGRLDERDIERMNRLRAESSQAVKTFGQKIRQHHLPMKPISAEFSFDGSQLVLNFTSPDRVDFRELARDLAATFHCRIELRQVGPRDEARLLGGVGRCGRTLCCASWLPMFPEISMNMAKTQDLPLNPSKVSGVCGRLLCCLSYENEQYKHAKTLMPRLGQVIETPNGPGMVVGMQVLRELLTIRYEGEGPDVTFTVIELGLKQGEPAPEVTDTPKTWPPTEDLPPTSVAPDPRPQAARTQPPRPQAAVATTVTAETEPVAEAESPEEPAEGTGSGSRRRRRRRGGSRRSGGDGQGTPSSAG